MMQNPTFVFNKVIVQFLIAIILSRLEVQRTHLPQFTLTTINLAQRYVNVLAKDKVSSTFYVSFGVPIWPQLDGNG